MMVNNQKMPDAWYELAGRVSTLRAIARCALDAVPCDGDAYDKGNHAVNLIAAMEDILKLMRQDVDTIEAALKL